VLFASYTFATEVVLFEKLGKNEVVRCLLFQLNFRQKNFVPSEHPTLRDAKKMRKLADIFLNLTTQGQRPAAMKIRPLSGQPRVASLRAKRSNPASYGIIQQCGARKVFLRKKLICYKNIK
jgi:hypothetical protein